MKNSRTEHWNKEKETPQGTDRPLKMTYNLVNQQNGPDNETMTIRETISTTLQQRFTDNNQGRIQEINRKKS